jgi:DNA-binding beta-propeller fold protein YncE
MNLFGYLKYAWRHIQPFFTDSKVTSAVWQIWFNRDYTQWAALKNSDAYTLTNWGVSDRFRYYIRKDIASQIWTFGAAAQPVVQPVDPYITLTEPFTADRTIGSAGTNAGQFQAPHGIALAPDGSLYVADAGNNRIQHLSPEGEVLQVWGTFADVSQGNNNAPGGTFNEPWGVAVGPDGSVYVADTWNHRVQKFTADGKFVTMWGHGPADSADAFYGPRGIAVDANGRVFVADTGNKRIVIFDPNGNLLGQFGGPGFDPGQFDEPVGVVLDASGKVYVTDTWNQRVQVFAPDASGLNFSPVAQWPVEAWFGQSLANKPFLTVDVEGNTFVSDPEACRVIEFDPGGQALHAWGSCGQAGSFTLPDGLALDGNGGLWVSDAGSGTLIHIKVEGP